MPTRIERQSRHLPHGFMFYIGPNSALCPCDKCGGFVYGKPRKVPVRGFPPMIEFDCPFCGSNVSPPYFVSDPRGADIEMIVEVVE